MSTRRTTFGLRLRALREAAGFTQSALAAAAGVDRSFYSGIEAGRRNISIDKVFAIADVLEVDVGEMFKELDDSGGGVAAVRWEDFENRPADFERLATLLLSRLHRGAVALDGRGGDGGRDLQWNGPDGLWFFECKKFTKIDTSQRRQIQRSLTRAATAHPARWVLVVPTDPRSSHLTWFEKLQLQYEFPLEWRGRAWLDEQIAAHPDIRRYVLDSAQDEVYRAVAEARAEQDYITGVPELQRRWTALDARADELSMVWTPRRGSRPDSIVLEPKPDSSPEDLTIRVGVDFPAEDQDAQTISDQVERALHFGGPVHLPAQYVTDVTNEHLRALGLPSGPANVFIPASTDSTGLPIAATIDVVSTDGAPQSPMLPMTIHRREIGSYGATLHGRDSTGLLVVRLTAKQMPGRQPTIELNLRFADEAESQQPPLAIVDPEALHRVVTVLSAMGKPNSLRVRLGREEMKTQLKTDADPYFKQLRDLLGDLVYIRNKLGAPLRVPDEWDQTTRYYVRLAAQLLRGEQAPLSVRQPILTIQAEHLEETLATFGDHGAMLDLQVPLILPYPDTPIDLGAVWIRCTRVTIVEPETLRRETALGGEIQAKLSPHPGSKIMASLTPFPDSNAATPSTPA